MNKDDNVTPIGIFLVIVMILVRLKTSGKDQKNPVHDLPCHGNHSSGEWKHKIHKAGHQHEGHKLNETGNKTDQKRDSHPKIEASFDNLPVHDNHICEITAK